MDVLFYSFLGVAIGAIFCVYRRYVRDCWKKSRQMRERVAHLLWAAANRNQGS